MGLLFRLISSEKVFESFKYALDVFDATLLANNIAILYKLEIMRGFISID